MQTRSLFAGWNITEGWNPAGTIWGICEGETYPFLNGLTDANPCSDSGSDDSGSDDSGSDDSGSDDSPGGSVPVVPPDDSDTDDPDADDSDADDPDSDPALPVLPPGEGSGQVDGQDVNVDVDEQGGALRLTGDGFTIEVRTDTDTDADMFAAVQGRPLQVVGTGFEPGSTANVQLRPDPYDLGSVVVDADGTFVLTSSPVPDTVSPCPHTLHIIGTRAGGGRAVASVGLWVQPARPPFDDVALSATHGPAIACLKHQAIVAGYSDGTYQPERGLSRGAAAALLYRMADRPHIDVNIQVFDDVDAGHPFANAIGWAHQQGIVQGYADGTYRPSVPVTRQAFAALLYRMAGAPVPAGPAPFVDVSPDTLFATEIAWLAEQNITRGYHDQTFRGATVVRRGPAATMLVRFQLATAQPDEN